MGSKRGVLPRMGKAKMKVRLKKLPARGSVIQGSVVRETAIQNPPKTAASLVCLVCGKPEAKIDVMVARVRANICDDCAGVGNNLLHAFAWFKRVVNGGGQ